MVAGKGWVVVYNGHFFWGGTMRVEGGPRLMVAFLLLTLLPSPSPCSFIPVLQGTVPGSAGVGGSSIFIKINFCPPLKNQLAYQYNMKYNMKEYKMM